MRWEKEKKKNVIRGEEKKGEDNGIEREGR